MRLTLACAALAAAVLTTSTMAVAAPVQGFNEAPANYQMHNPTGPQGFNQFQTMTVQEVKDKAVNHQNVTLVGRLTNYIGKDKYEFQDQTGTITVELDDDQNWQHIQKDQLIQIYGDVDKYMTWLKIEVKAAHPVQQ